MARPASPRLALTAMAATTMRGSTSLAAVRVWRVSWLMTMAPPTMTKRTKNASAMPAVIRHSSPTRDWSVTSGVANRVWPMMVSTGSRALVTTSRNQSSMAASMCPVMSKSPGLGWVPPLTDPPLPDAGVPGVDDPLGPTWIGTGWGSRVLDGAEVVDVVVVDVMGAAADCVLLIPSAVASAGCDHSDSTAKSTGSAASARQQS